MTFWLSSNVPRFSTFGLNLFSKFHYVAETIFPALLIFGSKVRKTPLVNPGKDC
jgi:hypothetical protein